MGLELQQTALGQVDPVNTPDAIRAALVDTQGNILKSNGRDNNVHLFLRFTGAAAQVRAWLQMMGTQHVTSAWQQRADAIAYRQRGADGGVFVNLCLSAAGYGAVGLTTAMPDDPSFRAGAKAAAQRLNDPPVSQWQAGFQNEIHALVIVAADNAGDTAAAAQAIVATLSGIAEVVDQETGAAMRLDRAGVVTTDGAGKVHEHFGFADGVSQPLFFAEDIEAARLNSGGLDQYDPSAPLDLVLLKDPGGGPNGFGSYFVYRKLAQDVAGFRADQAKLAAALAEASRGSGARPTDAECDLAGAYTVGRFRDGTPVVAQAVDGWLNEPNNFNFDADVDGVKCPFHAHIRKSNPRGDKARQFGLPPGEDRARRIVRRAVSFGPLTLDPAPDEQVGLLFICAQSSIVDQFEFIQSTWANFTDFLRPATGLDPIIGEPGPGAAGVPQQWPRAYGLFNGLSFATDPPTPVSPYVPYQFGQWVTMLGGEHFFVPSLSFLTSGGWTHGGGAISDVAPDATAFVHREPGFIYELKAIWTDPAETRANVEWAYHFGEALRPHFRGAYANYIDPLLTEWPDMYYGANYERLLRIKKAVDPDDLFGFQQGVGSEFRPSATEPLDLSPLNRTSIPGGDR